jgi:CRISPR-associated protein Csd2
VRNYVLLQKNGEKGNDIYIKEKAVLGRAHVEAFRELGIQLGEEFKVSVGKQVYQGLEETGLPPGITIDGDEDVNMYNLTVASDADKKEIKEWLKDNKPIKAIKDTINDVLKQAKTRKPSGEQVEQGREKMCEKFFDIRTFGGVLTLKSAPNCGQVRGPVQLTFARSIDQIVPLEHSITRMAVATEAEAEKQQGDNRTMGRKFTVPYALYRCHGFISAPLADKTGFSDADLTLLWDALTNMFEHDRSAARGQMAARKLVVFKHDSRMGKAPAHQLFDLVRVSRSGDHDKPPRDFSDYRIDLDRTKIPAGIVIDEKI